jgi:hypothetical protein
VSTDRLSLPAPWGRRGGHAEIRVPHALWKLAWMAIFTIARKSLMYWIDGLP